MKNLDRLICNLNRARSAKVPLLIIALVAVIAFSMAACNPGFGSGGGTQPGGGGQTNPGGNNGGFDSVTGLANKLAWLKINAQSGGNYVIEVSDNEIIESQELSYPGKYNITITLRGIGSNRIISLSSTSYSISMFEVGSGVTLVLENNITLYGNKQSGHGVEIRNNGTFTMNGGSVSGFDGHGVYLGEEKSVSTSIFNMKGGNISNNMSGVIVEQGCTFTMTGGTISNNTALYGGGVYVDSRGTFNNNYPSGIYGNRLVLHEG